MAGALRFLRPDLSPSGWMEAPFTVFCVVCGILVERGAHYAFGWRVDAELKHLAARYEAGLAMKKLRAYEAAGVLNQVDARRIAARIARRDISGGPRPAGKPRGPYKKKASPTDAPHSAAPPPDDDAATG